MQILRLELPLQSQGKAWIRQAQVQLEEHICGLGERADPLILWAQRGKAYQMWNYDAGGRYSSETEPVYLCVSVYLGLLSQESYLIFIENP